MSETGETPREELQRIKKEAAKRQAQARAKQIEEEQQKQTDEGMAQISEFLAATFRQQAELDPTLAKELNDIAVQARVAAEKLVDFKQLWSNASLGEKFKLTPGMARAVVLMGACNALTQGIYAGATEQAIAQAKADGSWTPEDVTRVSVAIREQMGSGWIVGDFSEAKPPVSVPDLPQVQPPPVAV